MPRVDEATQAVLLPTLGDMLGVRHWGDGMAGQIVASRIQGFYAGGGGYLDIAVDSSGQVLTVGGGGGGGGAVTIANGADVAEGNTADAAVTGDNAGTVSAKLRGLNKTLGDVWDAANHRLNTKADQGTGAAAAAPWAFRASDGAAFYVGAKEGQLPAALVGGRLDVNLGAGRETGTVSAANSSAATLGNGGVFVGAFEDVKDYACISVSVFADQASATDGLSFEWSHDGVNQDLATGSSVLASAGRGFSVTPRARFFRVRYTNGVTPQGAFRLGTVYHPSGTGLISRPLDQAMDSENYAEQVRAVVDGFDGANFQHIAAKTATPAAADIGLVVREAGNVAHDAVDAGNPLKVGGKVIAAAGTPAFVSATGDRVDAALDGAGRIIIAEPVVWTITHVPAANTVATASKAAGGAGVKHVLEWLQIAEHNTGAATAIMLTVVVRDGASGAGTILATFKLQVVVTTLVEVSKFLNDLHIVGSANTAMTVEFTAAGGANTNEIVNAGGYDTL